MTCPSCGQRKGRRACPALRQSICPTCCGSKRLAEIACPSDCGYLHAARAHPAAVVRRQQELDVATVIPALRSLTERQHQLFFLFHTLIARHVPEGFGSLLDVDVAEAAEAAAATLETSARGVIYEHVAPSLPAQRLASELRAMMAEMREAGATIYDHEAAVVLRAIQQGARGSGPRQTAYLETMGRLLQMNRAAKPGPGGEKASASPLIIP
jgi:hypothetical protein